MIPNSFPILDDYMNQTSSYFLAFLSRFLLIEISVALIAFVYVRAVMVVNQLWRKSDKRYTQLIKNIFSRFVFVCYTVQTTKAAKLVHKAKGD